MTMKPTISEPLTLEELHAIVDPILELVVRKNTDYGGSMFELGLKGIFVRITDKIARLRRLVWEGHAALVQDERITDVFSDLIGYSVGALVYSARESVPHEE